MNFIRAIGIRVAGSRVSLLLGTVGDANKCQVSRQADFAKLSAVAKTGGHVVGQERKDTKRIAAKELCARGRYRPGMRLRLRPTTLSLEQWVRPAPPFWPYRPDSPAAGLELL
jgi:hypothetical protein